MAKMQKIKMLQSQIGPKVSRANGEILTIDAVEAARMRDAGICEFVGLRGSKKPIETSVKKEAIETTTIADSQETTVAAGNIEKAIK